MNKPVNSLNASEILELIFIYLTEISSRREYDEILELLANMGRALTNADRCSVWVVSDDKKTISTQVAHGIDKITIPMGKGIVGSAILNGEKLIIDDVYKDERFNTDIDKQTGYTTKSMIVVPMYDNDDNVTGAFQAINRRGEQDYFDKRDVERLMLASTYAAETIIAAKLKKEISDTQKEVIFTMGAVGEARSKETGNHVKRVAEYSRILALAYGLSEDEANLLKEASPMHDIGKVAIPDNILNKPGRFDENEREIMNKHAELGYEMTRHSEKALLKAASTIAYEHHEKYDGSGYPRKLKGEEIHIYGRITALADVFDALGSDRVYKKAWSDEKIFKLLREERGKHFDPKLIDIFFEHLEDILDVRETFRDMFDEVDEKVNSIDQENIKVLGSSGTETKEHGITSFLLNPYTTIDAGSLLNTLGVDFIDIDTIWLTHSHLDHIVDIAYAVESYFNMRKKSLKIIALPETLKVLQEHFFNNLIWPDFSKINLENGLPVIEYETLSINKKYNLSDYETIRAFKTDHTVPSCGYIYTKNSRAVLITSDTLSLEGMIVEIQKDKNIKTIIVECSFPNELEKLAIESKHLTPSLLFNQLKKINSEDLVLCLNHIKPAYKEKISQQIEEIRGDWKVKILKDGEILHF
jgi:HD-GYP domain-containing protein (c-di-GMP phosphodiesterase class II)/phosphoribosyl 1,2-cyclic phosphodiesterase